MDPSELEAIILDFIEEIQAEMPELLDDDVDVHERIGISRSFITMNLSLPTRITLSERLT